MKTNTVVYLLAAVNLFILLAAAVAVTLIVDASRAATPGISASHSIQHAQTQSKASRARSRVLSGALIL